ncbi:rRNA maturation RNase YbeY [Helicobacter sp. 12S02634-8]|uniref:rRNA maturation RNase YbeY n=1 Tax=Helicobacter sp. 12S02634-8 TaxID=1476199 RepID=UPI000BA65012|nr:rRNA maturation RNase YbeY [Helicobacter sp. 12S02634-8]PAF46910.1 rRNA maturation RNase YbeY [Helicobacter sp. 12S02634-8]
MLEISNQTQKTFDYTLLHQIAQSLSTRDIELILSGDKQVAAWNHEFRSKPETTDVLSFPLEDMGIVGMPLPLGSVVINVDMAQRVASELGHSIEAEIALLFAHGVLHLLGYDHEKDTGEQRQKEEEIIQIFSLPKSLILRNE